MLSLILFACSTETCDPPEDPFTVDETLNKKQVAELMLQLDADEASEVSCEDVCTALVETEADDVLIDICDHTLAADGGSVVCEGTTRWNCL